MVFYCKFSSLRREGQTEKNKTKNTNYLSIIKHNKNKP